MKVEIIRKYMGLKIKIFLNNNLIFSGKILKLSDDSLIFLDKNNAEIAIENSSIISIIPLEV